MQMQQYCNTSIFHVPLSPYQPWRHRENKVLQIFDISSRAISVYYLAQQAKRKK